MEVKEKDVRVLTLVSLPEQRFPSLPPAFVWLLFKKYDLSSLFHRKLEVHNGYLKAYQCNWRQQLATGLMGGDWKLRLWLLHYRRSPKKRNRRLSEVGQVAWSTDVVGQGEYGQGHGQPQPLSGRALGKG